MRVEPHNCDQQARRHRSAFTLIEMITVLTIIILVLAIAIPVWNALMGGTNVASAQNQISALLANARADAIYNRQTIGVCFYIDSKTQRSAMAEVQVQPLWNAAAGAITPLYTPADQAAGDGPVNALELVNSPDPSGSGSKIFYRDPILLPAGVAVALNENTYTYNQAPVFVGGNPTGQYYLLYRSNPDVLPALDRYSRLGCIMFAPDGTLSQIPFAIPLTDQFTSAATAWSENLLCQKIGMAYSPGSPDDIASSRPATTKYQLPLMSSVALVIFDHDAYATQHATLTVQSGTPIGDGLAFTDYDLNYSLFTAATYPNAAPFPTPWANLSNQIADKFIEENWIDKNGTALMVNPANGSLIKAK